VPLSARFQLLNLAPLEAETRVTLGLREQSALARETALAVASCIAHHRDVSLNF